MSEAWAQGIAVFVAVSSNERAGSLVMHKDPGGFVTILLKGIGAVRRLEVQLHGEWRRLSVKKPNGIDGFQRTDAGTATLMRLKVLAS